MNVPAEETSRLLEALTDVLTHNDLPELRTKPPQVACPCCPSTALLEGAIFSRKVNESLKIDTVRGPRFNPAESELQSPASLDYL